MISPQEIRTVTFDKVMRGYRTEDVDALLQQLAQQMEELQAEKESTEKKLYVLAQKVEEYRKDEDNLKTALLNAQRMGENVIKEAKQKAESILREAGIKAEDITRAAQEQVSEEQLELERVKAEVAQFKNSVLSLYKQHIESLSTLPGDEPEEPEEEPSSPAEEEPEAAAPGAAGARGTGSVRGEFRRAGAAGGPHRPVPRSGRAVRCAPGPGRGDPRGGAHPHLCAGPVPARAPAGRGAVRPVGV